MENDSIKEKIVSLLSKHPDGLPILEIAKLLSVHRHTATKYVYELIGAGIIQVREVGTAKLCFLRKDLERVTKESEILEKLKKILGFLIIVIIGLSTSALALQNITEEVASQTIENQSAPPIDEKPILDVSVELPEKVTRGEVVDVKATITNIGSTTAKSVLFSWELPRGFEIVSSQTENCGTLESNTSCTPTITVQTSLSTELGINEIKVVVSYET